MRHSYCKLQQSFQTKSIRSEDYNQPQKEEGHINNQHYLLFNNYRNNSPPMSKHRKNCTQGPISVVTLMCTAQLNTLMIKKRKNVYFEKDTKRTYFHCSFCTLTSKDKSTSFLCKEHFDVFHYFKIIFTCEVLI